ncbi:unnamed protein product [Ophioblennius macclurei]
MRRVPHVTLAADAFFFVHKRRREMERRKEEEVGDVTVGEEEEEEDDDDGGGKDNNNNGNDDDAAVTLKKKKTTTMMINPSTGDKMCVPGILYLGHIPPRLRPKHLRNLLSAYGEIGRIFLQPEDQQVRKRKKKSGLRRCDFTEGWVEFRDKRVAKRVAASLHNTPMATRKRQRFAADLWNFKYLHRFQWTHLSERLAYEQTVLQQRLRAEVSQAKKETNFYLSNVERSARMNKMRKKRRKDGNQMQDKLWDFTQRQTEEEIQMRKKRKQDSTSQKQLDKAHLVQEKSQFNTSLLTKIFNSSKSA